MEYFPDNALRFPAMDTCAIPVYLERLYPVAWEYCGDDRLACNNVTKHRVFAVQPGGRNVGMRHAIATC